MTLQRRPCLRPFLKAHKDAQDSQCIILRDEAGLAEEPLRVSVTEFACLRQFDGHLSIHDIQTETNRQNRGPALPLEWFTSLVEKLDQALFLESPRYRKRLADPIREPSCLGCYEADPVALRKQIHRLFTGHKGPGLPGKSQPDGLLRAALIPHIDYGRGGSTFAWGFKEVFERTSASLFVIIGTAHHSMHRFTLTRKNFKTPLGVLPTDQAYLDRLVSHYGEGLFDDEITHLPEHSIELEVVFLQYLYENVRPIRIVPLVVGSFHDAIRADSLPSRKPDVGRMIEVLSRVEAEVNEPICYIISGDLAHIGPKFGDPEPVRAAVLEESQLQDQALLHKAEAADPVGYFQVVAREGDARRICGLPPTYTMLEALRPSHGKLLHYDQYVHPMGYESVSFASMAFYR